MTKRSQALSENRARQLIFNNIKENVCGYTLYFTASSQKYGYDKSITCDGSECEVSEIEAYMSENILISRLNSMEGAEDVNKQKEVLDDLGRE